MNEEFAPAWNCTEILPSFCAVNMRPYGELALYVPITWLSASKTV